MRRNVLYTRPPVVALMAGTETRSTELANMMNDSVGTAGSLVLIYLLLKVPQQGQGRYSFIMSIHNARVFLYLAFSSLSGALRCL